MKISYHCLVWDRSVLKREFSTKEDKQLRKCSQQRFIPFIRALIALGMTAPFKKFNQHFTGVADCLF